MSEQALYEAVYAAPEDDAPRRVLADYLQARGDPRGEFITLQLLDTPNAAQRARPLELLRAHGEDWCAQLCPLIDAPVFARGFVSRARVPEAIDDIPAPEATQDNPLRNLRGPSPWSTVEALTIVSRSEEFGLPNAFRWVARASPLREVELDVSLDISSWFRRDMWLMRTREAFEWQRMHIHSRHIGAPCIVGFGTRAPERLELQLELASLPAYDLGYLRHELWLINHPIELVRVLGEPSPSRPVDLAQLRRQIARVEIPGLRWLELPAAARPELEPHEPGGAWCRVPAAP